MKYPLLSLFLFISFTVFSQNFVPLTSGFLNCSQGGMSWGDFDNDGDLDAVMSGVLESSSGVMIYKNKNGEFTKMAAFMPGLTLGTVSWGDYDNDNDLDLLVCGTDSVGDGITRLYRNDNSSFINSGIQFTGIASGRAIWFDYNNDNLTDILIIGDTLYVTPVTRLYKNNGNGTFSVVPQNIPPVLEPFVAAGDYDNDGDQDLLIGGVFNDYETHLFRNDNGIFNETGLPFFGVAYGAGLFMDYDHDSDQDIIYMGATMNADYTTRIYKNDGEAGFVFADSLEGEWVGRIDAADMDNDGLIDLGVTGALCCGDAMTHLYRNNGNDHFSTLSFIPPDLYFSNINYGDYDNDGDADFLLSGIPPDGPGNTFTRLYQNQSVVSNYLVSIPPSVPTGLTGDVTGNDVTLRWNISSDNNTPSVAITYNLRIGTTPGGNEIMSSLSDPSTGFIKIFSHGNVLNDTIWTIRDLPEGDYYCAVQSLDQSCRTSSFSPEISFHIGPTGIHESGTEISVSPNPASGFIRINGISGIADIFDLSGRKVMTGNTAGIDISALSSGIYNAVVRTKGTVSCAKFIKH